MFLALLLFPTMKGRLYEVFLRSHQGCGGFALYALWRHIGGRENELWVYLLVCIITVSFSSTLQLLRIAFRNLVIGRKSVRATLTRHGDDTMQMTLFLPRPWRVRAGERVNITVPQIGLFYLFQTHPFAIAWWEEGERGNANSVSLLIRARSGFTKKLLIWIKPGEEFRAWIDGPFGPSSPSALGFPEEAGDYGHIFMVATGIGIAAQLPFMKELLNGHRDGRIKTRRITLVWQVEQDGDWECVREWLQTLVKQDIGYVSTA